MKRAKKDIVRVDIEMQLLQVANTIRDSKDLNRLRDELVNWVEDIADQAINPR